MATVTSACVNGKLTVTLKVEDLVESFTIDCTCHLEIAWLVRHSLEPEYSSAPVLAWLSLGCVMAVLSKLSAVGAVLRVLPRVTSEVNKSHPMLIYFSILNT